MEKETGHREKMHSKTQTKGVLHSMKQVSIAVLFFFSLLIIGCGGNDKSPCPTKTCSDYQTQQQAQAAFDADKACLGELDNDNDGIACEQLSGGTGTGSGSSCPTTSSCGCSNKTKDQCSGPCCKWTVGSGCGCK